MAVREVVMSGIRCTEVFKIEAVKQVIDRGSAILGQVKGYRSFIRRAVESEIEKQLAK
jgi:hypothetical protein